MVLAASIVHASTNFSYDATATPGVLPPNPPWITMGGSGGDQQIASDKLTLVDTNNDTAGFYYSHPLTATEIGSNMEFQGTSRVRLSSYGDRGIEKPLYSMIVEDGNRLMAWGMTLDAEKNTRFFFFDGSGFYGGVVHTAAGNGFFDVQLTKEGTSGGSDDIVTLRVDGSPVLIQSYGNFQSSKEREVYFGTSTGAAYGTAEVVRASFQIGTALRRSDAPTLSRSHTWPFRDGDRVVFLGDSITEQRLYTTYVECYLLTRFPTHKFTFRNAGHSGDTAWLRKRDSVITDKELFEAQGKPQEELIVKMVEYGLQRDVLPLKPTVVLIDLGVNDAKVDGRFPVYRRAMQELVTQLKKANVRVALLSTSPKEGEPPNAIAGLGYNRKLAVFAEALALLAAKESLPFADQLHPYIETVDRARQTDATFKTMPDGLHPSPAGHLLMAWGILKGLGAPSLVSEVTIDVSQGRAKLRASQSKVTGLNARDGVVNFTCTDAALPMPLPSEASTVLPYAPILDDLSRHLLRVIGLKKSKYDLCVDGQKVETLSREQLESGWNMTIANTPMTAQATQLMEKVVAKNNEYFHRWREVQIPALLANKSDDAEVKTKLVESDKRIAALEAEIELLRKPKPHQFKLKPAESK